MYTKWGSVHYLASSGLRKIIHTLPLLVNDFTNPTEYMPVDQVPYENMKKSLDRIEKLMDEDIQELYKKLNKLSH